MNCEIVSTRLGKIEYRSIGSGVPILFVHGGHSNCKETLSHKGFNLEKFQLITPSRPGYGNTPLNENKTPRQAADLIIELLNYLSIEEIIVYGISAGGLTAIELASNYPNRVSKLILASAVSRKWLDEKDNTYKAAKKLFNPNIEKITWGMVRFFSMIFPTLIAKSFYPQFSTNQMHKLHHEDIRTLVSTMKSYNSKAGFLNDIDQNINGEIISNIVCPSLIIHSENDNSVPLEHAQYSSRMISNSKLEVLQNEWGHLFWIGQDSEIAIGKTISFIVKNSE